MGVLENAREIAELIKKYNDQSLYQRIVDLRDEVFALKEENLSLKQEIQEARRKLEIKGRLSWRAPFYMIAAEGSEDGPYCQRCWDVDAKLVRLHSDGNDQWLCRGCDQMFTGDKYSPPQFGDGGGVAKGWS